MPIMQLHPSALVQDGGIDKKIFTLVPLPRHSGLSFPIVPESGPQAGTPATVTPLSERLE